MPKIHAFSAVVENMARSLDFYRLLGFDIKPSEDMRGYVMIDLEGDLHFAWNTEDVERSFNPGWEPSAGPGRIGVSLRCASPAIVDSTFRTIMDAGHTAVLEPFDAPWGARHCRVLDPDGNAIDLFAPLP